MEGDLSKTFEALKVADKQGSQSQGTLEDAKVEEAHYSATPNTRRLFSRDGRILQLKVGFGMNELTQVGNQRTHCLCPQLAKTVPGATTKTKMVRIVHMSDTHQRHHDYVDSIPDGGR